MPYWPDPFEDYKRKWLRPETTYLPPAQDSAFTDWVQKHHIHDLDNPDSHYDYRGAFQAGIEPDPVTHHWDDRFKQHGEPTFSEYSQYSAGPGDGGTWRGDTFVPPKVSFDQYRNKYGLSAGKGETASAMFGQPDYGLGETPPVTESQLAQREKVEGIPADLARRAARSTGDIPAFERLPERSDQIPHPKPLPPPAEMGPLDPYTQNVQMTPEQEYATKVAYKDVISPKHKTLRAMGRIAGQAKVSMPEFLTSIVPNQGYALGKAVVGKAGDALLDNSESFGQRFGEAGEQAEAFNPITRLIDQRVLPPTSALEHLARDWGSTDLAQIGLAALAKAGAVGYGTYRAVKMVQEAKRAEEEVNALRRVSHGLREVGAAPESLRPHVDFKSAFQQANQAARGGLSKVNQALDRVPQPQELFTRPAEPRLLGRRLLAGGVGAIGGAFAGRSIAEHNNENDESLTPELLGAGLLGAVSYGAATRGVESAAEATRAAARRSAEMATQRTARLGQNLLHRVGENFELTGDQKQRISAILERYQRETDGTKRALLAKRAREITEEPIQNPEIDPNAGYTGRGHMGTGLMAGAAVAGATAAQQNSDNNNSGISPAAAGLLGMAATSSPFGAKLFSRLRRTIENTKLVNAPARTWTSKLAGGGYPKFEYDHVVGDALTREPNKMWTKQELLDHFDRNQIQLGEHKLGNPPGLDQARRANQDAYNAVGAAREPLRDAVGDIADRLGWGDEQRLDAYGLAERAATAAPGNEELVANVTRRINERPELAPLWPHIEALRQARTAYREAGNRLGEIDVPREAPKYESYKEPGGENYREILITHNPKAPAGRGEPTSAEANTLTAERGAAERWHVYDGDGRRVGWVQDPRRTRTRPWTQGQAIAAFLGGKGTFTKPEPPEYRSSHWDEHPNVLAHLRLDDRTGPNGEKVLHVEEVQSDWHQEGRRQGYGSTDIPDAPFKDVNDWLGLGMKRVIDEAAKGGYDRVTWSPGEVQADRYGLDKVADKLIYAPETGQLTAFHYGRVVHTGTYDPKALPSVIGKEVADKLLATPVEPMDVPTSRGRGTFRAGAVHTLEGDGLKVEQHGLRAFYDQQLPNWLTAYGKKLGVKIDVEDTPMQELWSRPGFRVTPELRQKVLSEGQPLAAGIGLAGLQATQGPDDQDKDNTAKVLAAAVLGGWLGARMHATRRTFARLARVGEIDGMKAERFLKENPWAVVTAENPGGTALPREQNAARMAQLEARLRQQGFEPIPQEGHYHDQQSGQDLHERSFLVPKMTPEQARQLGKDFGQNSVLTPQGMVEVGGNVTPNTGTRFNGPSAPDAFSEFRTKYGRPVRYSEGLDFSRSQPFDVATATPEMRFGGAPGQMSFQGMEGPKEETRRGETGVQTWKAGLLTSPVSHERNIASNVAMGAMEAAKDAPAALFDRFIMKPITGRRAVEFRPIAATHTAMQGAVKGLHEARKIWNGAEPSGEIGTLGKYEGRELKSGSKVLNAYVNGVYRLLSIEDRPFFWAAYDRAKESLTHVAKGRLNMEQINVEAIYAAQKATFQNESWLAQRAMGFKRKGGALAEFVVPFAKTPANVATATVDYSPFGFVQAALKGVKAAKKNLNPADQLILQRAASEAFGRAATGTAIMAVGYYLRQAGVMTGPKGDGTSENQEQNFEGRQPNAIFDGKDWRSVGGVSPLGNVLALGAHFWEMAHDPEETAADAAFGLAGSVGNTVYEQSFAKGIHDLTEGVQSPKAFGRYTARQAGSVVPSGLRALARVVDPTLREPHSIGENIQAGIPFASKGVRPVIDQAGREVKRGGGRLTPLYDITNPREDHTNDPVIRALHRYGVSVGKLHRRSGESEDDFTRRQKVEGMLWYAELRRKMQGEKYQQADSLGRADLLERWTRSFRSHRARLDRVGVP